MNPHLCRYRFQTIPRPFGIPTFPTPCNRRKQIASCFAPLLARFRFAPRANDDSVVRAGSVEAMAEHDLAVRIVPSNAGGRKTVDNIEVRQQT